MNAERIKENKIPLDKNTWHEILSEMRSAFFNNRFDDYFSFLSGCYMSEKEISERNDFYLSLAAMISRHLRMTPQIIGAYPYLNYLSEDMAAAGGEDLVKAASVLSSACERASKRLEEKDAKKPAALFAKPGAIEDAGAFIEKYRASVESLFIEELDKKWFLEGDIDSTLALICELFHLERAEAEAVTSLWFNNKADFNQIVNWFLDDFCFLLRSAEENEWIKIFCRLALAYGYESANFYSYQAEAGFKLRDYPAVIELVSALEKKYKITPFLEHLKCFSLWQVSKTRECMSIIRRRLENDPRDILAALLAGDVLLSLSMFEPALKSYAYAYHIEPTAADILYSLARGFHACYFAAQTDLCAKKAMAADPASAGYFKFGVELYIKCDEPGAKALLDGKNAGDCPVCIRGVKEGTHVIEWLTADGKKKRLETELKDGFIHKFKYIPDMKKVEREESRDGDITVYRNSAAVRLEELLADYLVEDLDKLPKPAIDEFAGAAVLGAMR
ncbi:MAG: hypothetical protein BWY32_03208 [bacterium ADurb.Bin243]|mgnify:CR=1 FL=1|nr:MAG: hypothetical protein BWY32_03208 [bacterium ADurb.Bin243]HOD39522.1 hypothetical protein [Candidatus Wallbacteria bacterium]